MPEPEAVEAPPAPAAEEEAASEEEKLPPVPVEADGQSFPVSDLTVSYVQERAGVPPISELLAVPVTLGVTEQGYVAPRPGLETVTLAVEEIGSGEIQTMYVSAIRHTVVTLVRYLNSRGLVGIYVSPSSSDFAAGKDVRPEGDASLELAVSVPVVGGIRTLGAGQRVPEEDRINNPVHERIARNSPVQPDEQEGKTNLIRRDLLDDYVLRLNRHPGRRVDVAITPGAEAGAAGLDFLISENRPWMLYAQVSNTGTEQTDEWRERFGFVHNQFTNNDDIFSIDYTTTWFDDVHAAASSYTAPLGESERLRWAIRGAYSQFRGSDVGLVGEGFAGETWQIGSDLIYNIHQDRELFVDVIGGVRFLHAEIENFSIDERGSDQFLLPHIGVRLERSTQSESTHALVDFEINLADIGGTSRDFTSSNLGRLEPDRHFAIVSWDFGHSFYLEPVFNRAAWEDASTPESSTLAHEIALSFRGQHSFNRRLVSQFQQVVGGLYSVRGYPESVVSGDTALIASAEYRFHLPRTFAIEPDPSQTPLFGKPFRASPQRAYGMPDWDLVMRAFVDAGAVLQADRRRSFEENEYLVGAGVGLEVLYKRNLSVRVDWGFAMEGIGDGEVTSGSSQVHILATILY